MDCKENALAGFFWGTPAEVASRVEATKSSFRLVHPAGALPPAVTPFMVPADARAIQRGGRTVAHAWETEDATFLFMAGVQPPDLAAARGAQAAAVFPEMENILAEEGMAFANVVRTWLYIDRVCEWYGEFNAARSAFFETRHVFETFLPASTGIGSANLDGAALVAGAIAMKPKRADVRAEIVESPLQVPPRRSATSAATSGSLKSRWTPSRARVSSDCSRFKVKPFPRQLAAFAFCRPSEFLNPR